LFSSTHSQQQSCPPRPDYQKYGGYVWPIHAAYDIYTKDLATGAVKALTNTPGYDAEATVSPKGDRIVFTSTRDGDLELYSMKIDGSDVKRLTNSLGYDGGAFFSPDGSKIIFRGYHYKSKEEAAEYTRLLKEGVVKPTVMELFIMDADGSNMRQITHYNAASFAPYMHPDGERVIFSSNMHDPKGRNFDLYMINVDGSGLKRITFNPSFDGFPMFSADGQKLVFASNRANQTKGETNVFLAQWKD
jgi:Tol biopolymer transport system component